MNSLSLAPLDIPELMKKFGIRPSKSLGQNFLQDDLALEKIVDAADIQPSDDILEIGPGIGNLTRRLAVKAHSVTAVELDRKLFPALESVVSPFKNVRLVQGDILQLKPLSLIESPDYLVVANIPYYITSPILRHLLESGGHPSRMIMTVQKEVAERICEKPGRMSILSLSVQVYGEPRIVAYIPANAFYPPPKVDSALLRVNIYPEPCIPASRIGVFFKFIRAGFSQKRKTLRNSLSGGLGISASESERILEKAGIDPMRRAETLSIDEWNKLCSTE